MRAARVVGGLLIGVGGAAVVMALMRRRAAAEPRADLYFQDGSSLCLDREAPEAERLFALARALVGPGT